MIDAQTIAALVGVGVNGGAFALVSWLVKRTFEHTVPRLAEDFKVSLSEQRQEFLGALERKEARAIEDRRECIAELEKVRHEMIVLAEAIRQDMVRERGVFEPRRGRT